MKHYFFLCLFSFATLSFAKDPSHYAAARKLVSVAKMFDRSSLVDSLIDNIVISEPALQEYRGEIHALVRDYISSDAYRELRIDAIVHFFTEAEIKGLITALQKPSMRLSTREQSLLLKKYEKIFKGIKTELVEYMQRRLRSVYRRRQQRR